MTPHHHGATRSKLGTHWCDGTPEEYGPIYHFIREHPARSMAEAAQVQVLQHGAARGGNEPEERGGGAAAGHVPSDLVVAGDDRCRRS
jgi:hypothetical protein